LHELATNAAKHGALSGPSGTVSLSWTVDRASDSHLLKVNWREQGGPPVRQPAASGFGSTLIESGLPGATVRREFDLAGLIYTIELPMPKPSDNGNAETG
jgi:two-component sensor histidine kinase